MGFDCTQRNVADLMYNMYMNFGSCLHDGSGSASEEHGSGRSLWVAGTSSYRYGCGLFSETIA